jgi:hypothetical protein
VSKMAPSTPLRRPNVSVRRPRRTRRFALACESLESRQLLSVGNTGLVSAAVPALSAAQAQFAAPPVFSSLATNGLSSGQFAALSAVNQSPIIVVVFGVVPFSFSGGSNLAQTSSSGQGGSGSGIGTLNGLTSNSGNSTSGITLTSGSATSQSITPLNPTVTSSTNTPGGPPVILVPPPLPPVVVHLTASTPPATNQSNSTLLSIADEQPPSITHFGQGADTEIRHAVTDQVKTKSTSNSLLDFVEPYRPVDPGPVEEVNPAQPGAGEKAPAPAPDPANVRPLPAISDPDIDSALDLTDARILTRSRDDAASRSDDHVDQGNTHWSLSALFGVAAVATGGYHLVLREADRFRGRWIPRWAGADRPTKRKSRVPSR